MKHKHHIIPRHMGGQDSARNIVDLTIEEHAEAHRVLFEEHGHWQDEIAWKGLSGQIGSEDIIREKIVRANLGRKQSPETLAKLSAIRKGRVLTEEHKRKVGDAHRGRVLSQEHKDKLSAASKGKVFSDEHKRKLSEAQKNSPKHSTRGKKRPEHSVRMSGFQYRKEACPRCGLDVGINVMWAHEKKCTR